MKNMKFLIFQKIQKGTSAVGSGLKKDSNKTEYGNLIKYISWDLNCAICRNE